MVDIDIGAFRRLAPPVILILVVAIFALLAGRETQAASLDKARSLAAIGRLNVAGYRQRRQCTATLIAPSIALTAKHCMRAFRGPGMTAPGNVHLLLGYDRGKWREHHRVIAFGFPELPRKDADVVLLYLATVSSIRPLAITDQSTAKGTKVLQAGYGMDRAHVLSIDDNCRIIDQLAGGRLRHDCETTFGESGGPILAPIDGEWRIVAVISGFVKHAKLAEPVLGLKVTTD